MLFSVWRQLALVMLVCCGLSARAAEPGKDGMTAEQFVASLHFQQGRIALPGGKATLELPADFRYLSPADAEKVLVQAWGNPPGHKTLGMIFPADRSPLDDNGWGVVITYTGDGHVKDDDADTIQYDELLADMKKSVEEENAARSKEGYPAMTLVGWAEPPRYERATHKFYWAKELSINGHDRRTLNYNIRVLGREGVLVLNAVAAMDQVGEIREKMPQVVASAEFTAGNRYSDFDSSTDHVAEYGLAALVAGGVAAKLGLFGKLAALLIAFKKFILIGLLAIGSFLSKLFGRKRG